MTDLTTKNVGKDKLLWTVFLVSAAVTVITKSEIVWFFLGASGADARASRRWPRPWAAAYVDAFMDTQLRR